MNHNSNNNLFKRFSLYQGEYPLPQEVELMAEAEQRILLMIKARWLFLILLGGYEFSIILSLNNSLWNNITGQFFVPVSAFILMLTYNVWYQSKYKQFIHLRGINYIQIIFDILFAIIVIHYTGGVLSWAWLVFPMIVAEAAVLLEKKSDAWSIVVLCSVLYGLLLVAEAHMPSLPVQVPFLELLLQGGFTHDMLFWVRFSLIILFFAIVTTYMMGIIRRNEAKLKAHIITDSMTGLYNSSHFFRSLNSELKRAKRYQHPMSLIIINLENLKVFSQRFGYLEGNDILCAIAAALKQAVRRNDGAQKGEHPYDVDIICRYDAHKFAIILPNTPAAAASFPAKRAKEIIQNKWREYLPKGLRQKIAADPIELLLKVGISGSEDGDDYQQILKAAEEASC